MITKLTPTQEKKIPEFIDKYVKLAEKPTDRKKATLAVQALYESAKQEKPIVIFGKSPLQTAIMVAMCRILFKESKLIEKDSQLRSQLNSQLDSQLDSQLNSQLRSQLNSQLDSQLYSQLYSHLYSQLNSQLRSINNDWWLIIWWLVWAGWYAFGEYIGVKFDNKVLKIFMDFITNVSFIIPYKGIAFVSETPEKINWENKRLHCITGPAVKYSDIPQDNLYCIRGVKFTPEQFEKSKTASVTEIFAWEDIDQRSALLSLQPIDKLLEKIPKKLIDHTDELGGYDLYEIELKDIGKAKIISYKSWSSDKTYVKFVPPNSTNCLETIANLRHQTVTELKESLHS